MWNGPTKFQNGDEIRELNPPNTMKLQCKGAALMPQRERDLFISVLCLNVLAYTNKVLHQGLRTVMQ